MRKIAVLFVVLFCSTISIFAQSVIRGKITDSKDGSVIAGATVKVRGERISVVSASDGSFEIVTKSGKILEISEIGHVSQTVIYNGQATLNVVLVSDAKALSEVVVTGVGVATSKKKLAISGRKNCRCPNQQY